MEILSESADTCCSISVPPVPKRSSTKRLVIPITDFHIAGLSATGSSILSYAASTSVRTCGLFEMLLASCCHFVSRFAHATVLSTTRNSIDQLVWDPCHAYTVLCRGFSTSVDEASFMS